MKILTIGDIVGENAVKMLENKLQSLKTKYNIDFVIKRYLEELDDDSKLSGDINCQFNGCIFEVDEETGKTIDIKRLNLC